MFDPLYISYKTISAQLLSNYIFVSNSELCSSKTRCSQLLSKYKFEIFGQNKSHPFSLLMTNSKEAMKLESLKFKIVHRLQSDVSLPILRELVPHYLQDSVKVLHTNICLHQLCSENLPAPVPLGIKKC